MDRALALVESGRGVVFLFREQLRNRKGQAQAQQEQGELTRAGSHEDSRKDRISPHYEPEPEKKLL